MELSKRTLPSGSNVLIVDDFLKAGGTINGMRSLIQEFDSTTAGAVVFCDLEFLITMYLIILLSLKLQKLIPNLKRSKLF